MQTNVLNTGQVLSGRDVGGDGSTELGGVEVNKVEGVEGGTVFGDLITRAVRERS